MAEISNLRVTTAELNNEMARKVIADFFWSWFLQHSDDVLLEKKLWFLSVKIRVIDIEPLFVKLFGPRGASVQ